MHSQGLFLHVCLLLISQEEFKELTSRPSPFAAAEPIHVGDDHSHSVTFSPIMLSVSSPVESSELPMAGLSGISMGFESNPDLL